MLEEFPTQEDVVETWAGDPAAPVVTLACVTYMHEPFILDTLLGFVSQRTSFPFEIICYDDCSSDGTREKVEAFAERYPNIVRTVLPETNQYSQGIKPFVHIVTPLCKGRYIAFCEGDDFWSDPSKIQKQVDFLENNPDYVMTTHGIATIDSSGTLIDQDWLPHYYKRDFSDEEVRLAWSSSQIQSILYRNVIQEIPAEMKKASSGDVFFVSLLGQFGKAKYLDDIKPSMYRLHNGGAFSTLSLSDKLDFQSMNFYWLYKYYKRTGRQREARILRLRHFERGLYEMPVADIIRLIYVKLRRSRSMSTFSLQRH